VADGDVPIGAEETRTATQARYGGSASRGISTQTIGAGLAHIRLWWGPEHGELANCFDGRNSDDDVYFSGTGQEGDQHFGAPYRERRRLPDHAITGDSVRLLRYVAKNEVVYEAKACTARQNVTTASGQLLGDRGWIASTPPVRADVRRTRR
jgi:hypothetical protein